MNKIRYEENAALYSSFKGRDLEGIYERSNGSHVVHAKIHQTWILILIVT